MPKKAAVTTTFQKVEEGSMAKQHPNTGKSHSKMRKVEPLSTLTQFVFENQGEEGHDPPTLELVRQFQAYECGHARYSVLAKADDTLTAHVCDYCGHVKVTGKR